MNEWLQYNAFFMNEWMNDYNTMHWMNEWMNTILCILYEWIMNLFIYLLWKNKLYFLFFIRNNLIYIFFVIKLKIFFIYLFMNEYNTMHSFKK